MLLLLGHRGIGAFHKVSHCGLSSEETRREVECLIRINDNSWEGWAGQSLFTT